MENLILRGRPDPHNECDQWTLVNDIDDGQDYMVQEHIKLDALAAGTPYLRLVRRMTVAEFLATDQPPAVKQKLQAALNARGAPKS
jgi:hypothetical protein